MSRSLRLIVPILWGQRLGGGKTHQSRNTNTGMGRTAAVPADQLAPYAFPQPRQGLSGVDLEGCRGGYESHCATVLSDRMLHENGQP